MSKCLLYGNSCGDRLRLKVVGGSEKPTSPSKFTLWVKTSTAITAWRIFQSGNKFFPKTEGLVIINAAFTGAGAVDIVKDENFISIAVDAVYQYVSGAAKPMEAWMWNGSEWRQVSYEFMATIETTYPAGATCTCSNGSITLTAPDTSGSHTFTVPSAGEWTVKAVLGGETASEKITVGETNGAAYEASLSFSQYVVQNGLELIPMKCSANLAKSTETGLLVLKGTEYGYHYAQTEAVDLTGYKTFRVEGSTNGGFEIAVWRVGKKPASDVSNAEAIVEMKKTETSKSLDITNLNGEMLVGIFCGGTETHKISNLYLSKS